MHMRRLAVALIAAACTVTALVAAPTALAASARFTPTLKPSRRLARAADVHSRDMLRHDFFSHQSSDGTSFDRRVRSYAHARRVGENLAMLPGVRRAARKVVRMWLRSAAHRQILMSRRFRRVGVGKRSGQLGAQKATLYTVDFASRR
jgi:uncharacterized protein YkwD